MYVPVVMGVTVVSLESSLCRFPALSDIKSFEEYFFVTYFAIIPRIVQTCSFFDLADSQKEPF